MTKIMIFQFINFECKAKAMGYGTGVYSYPNTNTPLQSVKRNMWIWICSRAVYYNMAPSKWFSS